MHPVVALKRGHLPRPLFFRFQQLSLLRAMLLHLDLGSSHNTPALQPLSSVLCRSGAESFQPGRRPRTPESRDPDGRRATEGSARLTPVVDRLKTEKTVLSLRAQCGPIACAAQCNGQHARYGHRHLNPAGHGRSAKRAPNADGLDSWTKSLDPAVVPSISTWASAVCERLRTSPIFQYRRGVRMAAHIGSRVRGVSRANGRRPDVERALTSAKDAVGVALSRRSADNRISVETPPHLWTSGNFADQAHRDACFVNGCALVECCFPRSPSHNPAKETCSTIRILCGGEA